MHALMLGDDEEAVEQSCIRGGPAMTERHQQLIEVGDQYVLAPRPPPGLPSRKPRASREHLDDDGGWPIRMGNQDEIADDADVGRSRDVFQASANPGLDDASVDRDIHETGGRTHDEPLFDLLHGQPRQFESRSLVIKARNESWCAIQASLTTWGTS